MLAAAGAALLLAGLAVGWLWNGSIWGERYAQLELDHAQAVATGQQKAREEESRRAAAAEQARKQTQQELERYAADLADADSVAEQLRVENGRLRRTAENAAAAAGGSPTLSTLILYSELLDRCDARAGELAGEADRRRIAGIACERAYDSLSE